MKQKTLRMHVSVSGLVPALSCLCLCLALCLSRGESAPEESLGSANAESTEVNAPMPLKALLIAGGCCHDYEKQHRILYEGIQARAQIRVDVVWTRDTSHTPPFDLFDDPDWAQEYDLIIHDECAALQKDPEILGNILNAHKTVPAVHLHCAMHSFRTEAWTRHLGIKSDRHGPHVGVNVEIVDRDHPITSPLEDWQIAKDELYNNVDVFDAHPLAMGHQTYKNKAGKEVTDAAIVAWTNEKQGARSFSTSLGHFNEVVESKQYLDLVVRGALWACGKLDDPFYHNPYTGSNLVREIAAGQPARPAAKAAPAAPPADATVVKLSAISTQVGSKNFLRNAIDGDAKTRWCAESGKRPAWFQVEFKKPVSLTGAEIDWEILGQWMRYTIETSADGKNWKLAFDASQNVQGATRKDAMTAENVRFLKLTILDQQSNMWPSLWELRLYGSDGKQLKLHAEADGPDAAAKKALTEGASRYKEAGNVPPRAHRLAPAEEAALLKDVSVPDGFTASLFAPWQMANYPTYVAAAPNGDLYVSSDGNASVGRQQGRGRVLRLRDTDQDGRADQVSEFVRDIDSPRGLLWDHDRLYLLHPPHITVFHDQDGDGVAESSERLISDIAFGFQDRPADHTTNGLEMGVDGWIYIAVGDFGFMKATGKDGRTLQMRGGGVVRFRPDGSGMETFSDGTRNIYGIAVTPTLDLFARDNTNDGGGWDVRFHHLSGLDDHGYPRLYMNFSDEIIAPLGDYGGGSGVGAFYLGEPGIPEAWNNRPYTCDWGRQGSYRHELEVAGATFKETSKPEIFFKMTRPTDADVDGCSAIYQASWKGPANFSWKSPDQGYIARMVPSDFAPEPLPDFENLSDDDLVLLLRNSSSNVRRLAAQRTLLRGPASADTTQALLAVVKDSGLALENRIAALYAMAQRGTHSAQSSATLELLIAAVPEDDPLAPFITRATGDMGIDLRTAGQPGPTPAGFLKERLQSSSPRNLLEAIIATVRQGKSELAPDLARHLSDPDPLIQHTTFRALAMLKAWPAALASLDAGDAPTRAAAARALMRIHDEELIDALLAKLSGQTEPAKRHTLLAILTRLYHREGVWKGDSWRTRPDTRGPYYQPETWGQSSRILAALNGLLKNPETSKKESSLLVSMIGKNRIQNDQGLEQMITLARNDSSLLPSLLEQLATKKDLPPAVIPLVIEAAKNPENPSKTHQTAVRFLLTLNHPEAFDAILSSLGALMKDSKASKVRDETRNLLLNSPKLENYHHEFETIFKANPGSPEGRWAAQVLLQLAGGKNIGVEAREGSRMLIDEAWSQSDSNKHSLMEAAFWTRIPYLNERIRVMLSSPNAGLAQRAEGAAKRLGIQKPGADTTPKIAALKPEAAVAQAVAHQGGDVALGEAIYARATCVACHTVSTNDPPKGPYLGSIAEIYRRPDLAEAILMPNKTIAQGFKTNLFTLKDGTAQMGFVTDEAGDSVTMRDISSARHTFQKSAIAKRDTLPTSLMPPGLMQQFSVHEFASLLDYLESLIKDKD